MFAEQAAVQHVAAPAGPLTSPADCSGDGREGDSAPHDDLVGLSNFKTLAECTQLEKARRARAGWRVWQGLG